MAASLWVTWATASEENLLANPGFESRTADQPDRWDYFVQPKPGAVARLDDLARGGDFSVWLHTPDPYDKEPVNNWSQNVIADFGGQTLRVSGYLRVSEAKEAALWLQCWRKKPWGVLAAASTSIDTPVYGTAEWQEVSMDVDIPQGTDFVTLRCVLLGTGSAWFDDISLTRVDGPAKDDADKGSTVAKADMKKEVTPDVPVVVAPVTDGEMTAEAAATDAGTTPAISKEEAKRQEAAVMPLVNQLESEVRRLRDANLLLTDTLQQIQEVNQGLVGEMLKIQAELQEIREENSTASAPLLEEPMLPIPPLIPLSEAMELEAP